MALGLVAALLVAPGCKAPGDDRAGASSSPAGAASSGPAVPNPPLPARPAAVTLTAVDPAERADQLAAATADTLADLAPGWVAAYAEFGVPITDLRDPAPGSDPIGPRWGQVWSVGQMSRGRARVPLDDVARAVTVDSSRTARIADGTVLLADLRATARSRNVHHRAFARFIARKSVQSGHADPLNPKVTADAVFLDAATVQLLSWVVLRQVLVSVTAADVAATRTSPGVPSSSRARAVPVAFLGKGEGVGNGPGEVPCSQAFGDSDAASWIPYLLGKLSSGLTTGLEKPDTGGTIERLIKSLAAPGEAGKPLLKLAAKVGTFINWANAIASMASLYAQLNAMHLSATPQEPRITRKKEPAPGSNQAIAVRLTYENTDPGDDPVNCALAFLATALGFGLTIPEGGSPVKGSKMVAMPGQNMPDKVEFVHATEGEFLFATDSAGRGSVEVRGRAREKKLPDSAKKVELKYGVQFRAQPEEATGQSALNFLIDGISAVVPIAVAGPGGLLVAGPGIISMVVDLMRLAKWDVGSITVPFTDWKKPTYTASGGNATVVITGTVEDVTQPFTLNGSLPGGSGTAVFTPTGESGGTISGRSTGPAVVADTKGTYTLVEQDDGYLIEANINACFVSGPLRTCQDSAWTIQLTPVDAP